MVDINIEEATKKIASRGFLDIAISPELDLFLEIEKLKKEKNAIILAHYYQGIAEGFATEATELSGGVVLFKIGIYGYGAADNAIKDQDHLATYSWLSGSPAAAACCASTHRWPRRTFTSRPPPRTRTPSRITSSTRRRSSVHTATALTGRRSHTHGSCAGGTRLRGAAHA